MRELTETEEVELDRQYRFMTPTEAQIELYAAIREAAKNFERVVLQACPASADRTFACRQIRDARMTANRAIALGPG